MFKPVPKELDIPSQERAVLNLWEENQVERRYLERNQHADAKFSFIDGPITANGIMGVHHAWGRSYKDLWQRYNTMLGKRQRYQNGFDGQGLWVEVTVERQLGFTSKRDIEAYGVPEFVRKCKESVFHFADIITEQTKRLGSFMDWSNSYFTLSDQNNYTIWRFLKTCHERGLIYLGTDVMPWCTHCGTGMSETEVAEGYELIKHKSVYVKFPLRDVDGEFLLVWTTTPWTLTSNVAVAVNPALTYVKARQGEEIYYVADGALHDALQGNFERVGELAGTDLVGRSYVGPFDHFSAQTDTAHTVIPWQDVGADEGTGLVHIAPGCGAEDFSLGKQFDLAVVAPIDQNGTYVDGFDWLTGRNVQDVGDDIIADLRTRRILYRSQTIEHRYPRCWRCHTELVFRLVDEWFIALDSLREPMMEVAKKIRWIPEYGLDRELDWLRNMGDWMISKKRYWGLALPFWVCSNEHLNVIGGKEELFSRGITGLDSLESPHRPWIDEVTILCEYCGETAQRVPDVGNVWLDAGVVPFSTLDYATDPGYWKEWFPAQFITESFPGQFRNWFYSMLAFSTVLENREPFQTVLGYALMRDETGRDMHKSWGNLIPFEEAADRAGADTMRWLFALHDPEKNLNFGWGPLDEVKRRLLVLWNTYSFFVTYATLDGWTPDSAAPPVAERSLLDRWILARLHVLIAEVRRGLDDFNAAQPAREIDRFIEELSTWYVRRSRRRFWRSDTDDDKLSAYATLYDCLTTLTQLLGPFMPFLSETLYQNLVLAVRSDAPLSVHLTDFPTSSADLVDDPLLRAMGVAQRVVALGRAARDKSSIRVRQPLARMYVKVPGATPESDVTELRAIILDELNVKDLAFVGATEEYVEYSIKPNLPVLGPKYGKLLGSIREALDNEDPASVVAAIEVDAPITLKVQGEQVQLMPTEVLVSVRERAGYAAMAGDGYLVALDTQFTPELIREGWAREVVRRVNDWRRAAAFNVEDRITIRYQASDELAAAMQENSDYVLQETLAISMVHVSGYVEPGEYEASASFGDQHVSVALDRYGQT